MTDRTLDQVILELMQDREHIDRQIKVLKRAEKRMEGKKIKVISRTSRSDTLADVASPRTQRM